MKSGIAIVTGASSGIGAQTAIRLANDFTGIVLVARRSELLEQTAGEVQGKGVTVHTIVADLHQPEAAEDIVRQTIDRFGRIDALVNIAGAVPQMNVLQMTDQQWDDSMQVKFHSARRLAVHAWPLLMQTSGSVIFVSGTAAENPKPNSAAIASINAAINALAKAFAEQGIQDGVRVNAVLPGPIWTDRRKAFLEKSAAASGADQEEVSQKLLAQFGIARYGEPLEVAELIAFLLSRQARFITGTAIRIDGGEVKGI
ncbi:3-oxoacyl-[acyl-carrier protein] reductase [Dyadobacter soli]|uniref:3-oxoacyl-[acyl-carrier protein] reductase n=1 Tax=Dyadobacter soli TaxID=659014 RepID=A0A1G7VLL1_9BACT|nr:SDR family oxidoreductase [Dyadobacter soli]SDG60299.1 3-oxoacyl-[acyl-carrier protein] reductase [Dyadobacter soli]